MNETALSRRGLLGAGLRRAFERQFDALEHGGGDAVTPSRDEISFRLGARLLPVADAMVGRAQIAEGQSVLVAAAGNDALGDAAHRRGAAVASTEDVVLDWPDASFDAVLGFFSVTAHPQPRTVATELQRVARPCAPIVLAAWQGQPWARYETAYRHFSGFPEFDVHEHELPELDLEYSLVFARKP